MVGPENLSLSLIAEHCILDRAAGLNEPSGLTLNNDGTALFTVSDDTKAVFKLDLKGRLKISESFFIDVDDLEGITISADGRRLLAVQEQTNSIITIDIANRKEISRRPLAAMENYGLVADHFPDPPDNKGLEGITVNSRNNHVFAVKEGRPGLLIEISPDLGAIIGARLLTATNGFEHSRVGPDKLDFSGLSHDSIHNTLWITSDQGQCLFHYDWGADQVLQRLDLNLESDGKSSRIRKAEGVAFDPVKRRLYVVSDRDASLYVFQVNGYA